MDSEEIIQSLKKYNLKPASKRDLPLFTFSLIARAYVILLKKKMGFSHNVVAALGDKDGFISFFDEEHIALETEKYLKKKFKNFSNILRSAENISQSEYQKIIEADKKGNSRNFLTVVLNSYPKYFLSVALVNCFWRYLGNESSRGKLTPSVVKKLSARRKKIVQIYPRIEKLIAKNSEKLGKENRIDGKLLKLFTVNELKSLLAINKLEEKNLIEAKARRKGYLYLFRGKKEYATANAETIKQVKKFHRKALGRTKENDLIRGYAAYPGIVKGIVYNRDSNKHFNFGRKGNIILVTSMTKPDDIGLVKKCAAVVTDEGGILSHAAIVARELKKPCVIGTKNASTVLKNGDMVEVDASRGIVKILK